MKSKSVFIFTQSSSDESGKVHTRHNLHTLRFRFRIVRSSQKAMELAREEGLKVGLIRPITLFPFPSEIINKLSEQAKGVLVVEMNAGQMVEDVRLSITNNTPVSFYGRMGGMIPQPDDIVNELKKIKV